MNARRLWGLVIVVWLVALLVAGAGRDRTAAGVSGDERPTPTTQATATLRVPSVPTLQQSPVTAEWYVYLPLVQRSERVRGTPTPLRSTPRP